MEVVWLSIVGYNEFYEYGVVLQKHSISCLGFEVDYTGGSYRSRSAMMGATNMKWKASKISTMRTWGLLLVLVGMGVMVFGTSGILLFGNTGKIIAAIFMVLGMISCFVSMGIYFWVGMLSTSAPVIECPQCGKRTKMLGKTDRCMYCHTILTNDPAFATENSSASATIQDAK
jgi:hypothetical protein